MPPDTLDFEEPIGQGRIEAVRKGRGRFTRPIADVPGTREPVVLPRRERAGEHRLRVRVQSCHCGVLVVGGANSSNGSAGFGAGAGLPVGARRKRASPASTRCIMPR